jgi:hypothetical protein
MPGSNDVERAKTFACHKEGSWVDCGPGDAIVAMVQTAFIADHRSSGIC